MGVVWRVVLGVVLPLLEAQLEGPAGGNTGVAAGRTCRVAVVGTSISASSSAGGGITPKRTQDWVTAEQEYAMGLARALQLAIS